MSKTKFEKALTEDINLPEEVKTQLKEAWDEQLSEAKDEAAAVLREEFSQKYEHDKAVIVETFGEFIEEQIKAELTEFAEDKKALVKEKVEYKKKLKAFEAFITSTLAEEIKELRSDRVKANESVRKLEGFVIEQLSEEIKSLHADKKALVEQRVKLVKEGKAALKEAKQQFLTKAATLVETNIEKALRHEITQFREDIAASRQNDFGRRVFEAFGAEYMTSHLNESSEISKLNKLLSSQKEKMGKLAESVREQKTLTESAERKAAAARDSLRRDRVMSKLLSPLGGEKKTVMKGLLESVSTDNLEGTFKKYLPAVLNEHKIIKTEEKSEVLRESLVLKTGDRAVAQQKTSEGDLAIADIIRLAGLNKS